VLLGHSMGSFLVRTYLCRYPGTVDAAVLSGTGQENGVKIASGHMVSSLLINLRGGHYVSPLLTLLSLGVYNHAFAPNRTRADWISRDEEQVDAYIAHIRGMVGAYGFVSYQPGDRYFTPRDA